MQTETTQTDYQKQANDFLESTKTEFSVKYLRNGKYWDDDDDKDERDIYLITIKRGNRSYNFNFGQSLNKSGEWLVKDKNPRFTKTFPNKQAAIYYAAKIGNSFNVTKNPNFKAPTAYDVLTCLQKYEVGTFENFCSEFGYDTDSRKAQKIYKAVVNEWQNVAMLFTDKEIEQLQEIQ